MSKTEQEARSSIARKGYWVAQGKRGFDTARRMQARGAIPGATYQFDAFNGNSSAWRSQWNSPRCLPCYEVEIRAPANPSPPRHPFPRSPP